MTADYQKLVDRGEEEMEEYDYREDIEIRGILRNDYHRHTE